MRFLFLIMALWSAPALADPITALRDAAHARFARMPELAFVSQIDGRCGADAAVNPDAAYCTSENTIFVSFTAAAAPERAAYQVAHVMSHAVQVRHGVADVALREITRRRNEEEKLRGWVTRQVECIAGFLFHEAGLPETDLRDLFEAEPMTGSHWGRDPLAVGPKVSIGLEARAEWFSVGQKGDLSACAVGEFGSELLIKALRED